MQAGRSAGLAVLWRVGVRDAIGEAVALGIPAVALFPATDPALKTPDAKEAVNTNNLVCRAIRAVKEAHGDAIGVIADVALDPYSSHGVLVQRISGDVEQPARP